MLVCGPSFLTNDCVIDCEVTPAEDVLGCAVHHQSCPSLSIQLIIIIIIIMACLAP